MQNSGRSMGPYVTAAGVGINLALGVLYAWSIFKAAIKQSIERGGKDAFHWSMSSLNDPYAICCLVFACAMIVAGRCQDRFGARITASIGGLLVGAGFLLASGSTEYSRWVAGFGVLAGAGIAFGYSAATPAALKWYPPSRTGRIAGIVVSGFGLASVYIAPLTQYLLDHRGLAYAMRFYGIAFPVMVCALAWLLVPPPSGYVPAPADDRRSGSRTAAAAQIRDETAGPLQILRTKMFWILWVLYFIGAGAGLMVIGSMAGMAKTSMGQKAFLAVAILAVGNAAGRIAAGMLSDRIGRKTTLVIVFAFQVALMFASVPLVSKGSSFALQVVILATFIGFNYGANLALFPSYAKDLWGAAHFGVNYGILFTAWGIGGLVMSRVSQKLIADTGNFRSSFMVAGAMLLAGTAVAFLLRDKKEEMRLAHRRRMKESVSPESA